VISADVFTIPSEQKLWSWSRSRLLLWSWSRATTVGELDRESALGIEFRLDVNTSWTLTGELANEVMEASSVVAEKRDDDDDGMTWKIVGFVVFVVVVGIVVVVVVALSF